MNLLAVSGSVAVSSFASHPGYARIFAPDMLTVGIFLPLWPYDGDFRNMSGQAPVITAADRAGFGALWLRDVPLQVSPTADVGQVYDPWTYAAWLAAKTDQIAIATGSVIFTLRHPIDLAKQAASLDRLSGGRLVLGVASGDRPAEFPAYGVDFESRAARFREAIGTVRALLDATSGRADLLPADSELLPKPTFGRIPMLVTGMARQTESWIAEHADGWLTYPGPTTNVDGPRQLGEKIARIRSLVPDDRFLPVATNEWIDLVENPAFSPIPLEGGRVMRTGTEGLIELLERWRQNGVNHGALGVQLGKRPAADVIQQLGEEVVPHFPVHADAPSPATPVW